MLKLFQILGLPDWIARCATGEIPSPEFTYDVPCNLNYGFPPAILPIFSNSAGPDYVAVLHHWFGERQTTFVRYHKETQEFTEIARTPEQLRIWITFGFLRNVPDLDEVGQFAQAVGLCPSSAIEEFFSGYEDVKDLANHPEYSSELPISLVDNKATSYSGDFPMIGDDLSHYCQFEVSPQVVRVAEAPPPWFSDEYKLSVFDRLIGRGNLSDAWFCLNSIGWKLFDAKASIQRLCDNTSLNELSILNEWLRNNVSDDATY